MNVLSIVEINSVSGAGEYLDAASSTLAGMGIVGPIGGAVAVSNAYTAATAAGGTITNAALIESMTLGTGVAAAPVAAFGGGFLIGMGINSVTEYFTGDTLSGHIADAIWDWTHDDSPSYGSGTLIDASGDSYSWDYIFRA